MRKRRRKRVLKVPGARIRRTEAETQARIDQWKEQREKERREWSKEMGYKSSGYKANYPRTYAVINRDSQGFLVVALIDARGQVEAVSKRHEALGSPEPGRIVAVSRSLPGDYGTGATRLYPVTYVPPIPVTPRIRVGSEPIRSSDPHSDPF